MIPRRHHRGQTPLLLTFLLLCALGNHPVASAADDDATMVTEAAAVLQANGEDLNARAEERRTPLAEGEERILHAVVMATSGRSQWRPNKEVPWKNAAVDDILKPGAMIRTGRRSSLSLRVGQNASVLVNRNTRLVLPEIIQRGGTLRTTIQVTRGRADFKVDKIGLTNDFSVMTPSATLAVRGTGYAVAYGGFQGTELSASPLNEMFAIEVQYFLSRLTFFLSGGASTSDGHQNPVLAELFKTFGPPQLISALIEDDANAALLVDSLTRSPVVDQRLLDFAAQSLDQTQLAHLIVQNGGEAQGGLTFSPESLGFLEFGGTSYITEFICGSLTPIFDTFANQLIAADLSSAGISFAEADIRDICAAANGTFVDQDLVDIVQVIVAYCEQHNGSSPENISSCVNAFFVGFSETYVQQHN